jgi:predicted RNA polymerase sigma factor
MLQVAPAPVVTRQRLSAPARRGHSDLVFEELAAVDSAVFGRTWRSHRLAHGARCDLLHRVGGQEG